MKISTALSAVALLASAMNVRADDPAPALFQGNWVGTIRTRFGLAAPNDPGSWECLPGQNYVNIPNVSLNITATQFKRAAYAQQNVNAGAATYRWPADDGVTQGWSTVTNDNILMLRMNAQAVECKWARVTGTGNNRKLVIVTLGGDAYPDWEAQCLAANYQAIGSLEQNPICVPLSNVDKAAFNSTILETYTIAGANQNNNTGNGTVPTASPVPTASASPFPAGNTTGTSGAGATALAGIVSIVMAGAVLKNLNY